MSQSMKRALVIVALLLGALSALPAGASAHGPVAPVASAYQARPASVPSGIEAKVIDGDQKMWLRVDLRLTVVVLDYQGAPYLRFSPGGIEVNHNSAMYYLNETPIGAVPPTNLNRSTPPSWKRVSKGHSYGWHDGRLHALATVAGVPGATYLGRWQIPLQVDGRATALTGGLYHAADPSLVWFWPILVLIACVLAVRRLGRPELDLKVARGLALVALIASLVAAAARGFHGRPTVSGFSLFVFAITVGFVIWGLYRLRLPRPGTWALFLISLVAIWEGAELIQALINGFVLAALPPLPTRLASVICMACGVGALLLVFGRGGRRGRGSDRGEEPERFDDELDGADAGNRESFA